MLTFFDEAPASTSLLLQCGYRSKVCTNPRTTKIDGSLHNLCEFHRRKANLSQQRLHKRHRDEQARANTAAKGRPTKRTQLAVQIPVSVDPIPFTGALFDASAAAEASQDKLFFGDLAPGDIELLDLLLLDEINTLPNSPSAVDGISSCK
jgi:hypothetical protein